MRLIWYFDLISPFAYLALPAIERLAREHEVTYRPIVFGAVLSHWGQLGPAEIAPKRIHTYQLCQFLAEQAGIPFRFPPRHPFRSLDMLRLLAATGEQSADPAITRTVFDAIWAEGRDPSDPAEWFRLAAMLDIPPDAGPQAKARLRIWTEEAIAAGVFGVPTLSVDGALFWGLDSVPMAEAAMADPDRFAGGEMARLAALPTGVERKTPA